MKNGTIHHPLQFSQVRIENTNLCTYQCVMCPREKQTRKTGIMSMADLDIVLDRVKGDVAEIHLHGYGEPLLDRALLSKARVIKERFPDSRIAFITTLGIRLPDTFFPELAHSGVSIVGISCYGFTPSTYKAVHGVDHFKLVCENLKLMVTEKSRSGNPFEMFVITTSEKAWKDVSEQEMLIRKPFLEWLRSSGIHLNENFSPHNYGGGREYIKPNADRACSIVWGARREILQITWNLDVIPCCYDYNGSVVFGNLRNQTLPEIFTGQPYLTFIEAHQKNDLKEYPVCMGCERCFMKAAPSIADSCR